MNKRFVALDVFRGLTIALMIIVNNPGSWSFVYAPLKHANFNHGLEHWFGSTPTDWVFPFFLFIVGVSLRFSLIKYKFTLSPDLAKKIIVRSLTIIVFGLILNAFPFVFQNWDLSHFRFSGVLQRIGVIYLITAFLVLKFNCQKLQIITPSILVGYWAILWFFGGSDPYGVNGNAVQKLDMFLLGSSHLWQGYGVPFDPEGILSTLPGIVTCLFGFRMGMWLHQSEDLKVTSIKMMKWGLIGTVIGVIWGLVFPISKPLWSSSYVVHTGGLATLFLGFLTWVIEVKKFNKWTLPFVIFGTNSIFIFLASGLWARILNGFKYVLNNSEVTAKVYLFETVFNQGNNPYFASLMFAFAHLIFWGVILSWMYSRKIFIKI